MNHLYQVKYDQAFCRRFSKKIEISYIHIIEKDRLIDDGQICAEAKINHTCLEKSWCSESNCSQNNCFGQEFMQLR